MESKLGVIATNEETCSIPGASNDRMMLPKGRGKPQRKEVLPLCVHHGQ